MRIFGCVALVIRRGDRVGPGCGTTGCPRAGKSARLAGSCQGATERSHLRLHRYKIGAIRCTQAGPGSTCSSCRQACERRGPRGRGWWLRRRCPDGRPSWALVDLRSFCSNGAACSGRGNVLWDETRAEPGDFIPQSGPDGQQAVVRVVNIDVGADPEVCGDQILDVDGRWGAAHNIPHHQRPP